MCDEIAKKACICGHKLRHMFQWRVHTTPKLRGLSSADRTGGRFLQQLADTPAVVQCQAKKLPVKARDTPQRRSDTAFIQLDQHIQNYTKVPHKEA